ncbi:MAG: DEAD/DEAH box helicase, partial [Actinobacteria bacterium]|nr:DEAD/DEAH box helicase [Actinomycetota bacterium]
MPKFGDSNARAAKKPGAPKSTHRKGASAADDRGPRKPRAAKSGAPSSRWEDRAPRTLDRDARPGRDSRDSRDARPAAGGDKRRDWSPTPPARRSNFQRDDRAPRTFDRDSRPARDGAAPRRFEDRPARTFDRDSRPARKFEDRPARSFDRDSRPARDDRAPRTFDRDSRPARDSRDGGASRRFEDRPARTFDRDSRPARDSRDGDSRPARTFDRAESRGPRKFDDRPRKFDRDYRDDSTNGRPDRADRVDRDRDRDRTFEGARKSNPNKKAFFEDQKLERLESVDASTVDITGSFGDMNLHPKLLVALEQMGVTAPFPIQAATIPAAIGGMDVLGRGKTGSGKTVAFIVPLVTKLIAAGSVPRKPGKPRALVLAPTRELADQIDRTANALAKSVGFYTACIYGGVPQRRQENMMSRGTDIVVATPGRLEDLMAQGVIDLSEVETIVVDEADHMCDLGFIEPVKRIMRACGDSQKLLFSATLDKEVDALVREFLPAPFVYEVPNEVNDTANIVHRVLTVDQEDRSQVLLRLVQGEGKSLIFARTKMTAERLSESLTAAGVPAARLHGDLNQNQRNRNLERFVKGHVRVLVATDVAARGIHVDDIALVVQVDPPEEYKTYLHRAGRTGRAGKEGTVVTLIPRNRRRRMEDMLNRAERDGIFSEVRPSNPLLEQLAGP